MIEDRNLAVGTKLAATYKKGRYECEVVQTDDGVRYRLADGRDLKTPSAAGQAITGGACNGWRFWSVAESLAPPATPEATSKAPRQPRERKRKTEASGGDTTERHVAVIGRLESQENVPDGHVRYWCKACADSFDVAADVTPLACPTGHVAEAVNGEVHTVETTEEVESAEAFEDDDVADPVE